MTPFEKICHLRHISGWIERFAPLVGEGARVLDVACGGGRHGRFFLGRGAKVTCLDKIVTAVADLAPAVEIVESDLENGDPWPLAHRQFDAVVVVNYLHRPLFSRLIDWVAPGGVLLYETFALGNEVYDRPRNPDHLLAPGELLAAVAGRLQVVAYESGVDRRAEGPKVVQRICAVARDEPVPLG